MAKKERPLTEKQIEALRAAEPTFFGDAKLSENHNRTHRGLRNRGLIEGTMPHVYLTDTGRHVLAEILTAPT